MKKALIILSVSVSIAGNLFAQQDVKTANTSTNTNADTMKISENNKITDNKQLLDNSNLSNGTNIMSSSNQVATDKNKMMMPDLNSWPEASRMAVEEITAKYGTPDGITEDELFWLKKGNWKKICISKRETKHSFPIEHTDMMQQTISYDVPEDKMDDLGKFDGSVTFDRTQGTMSARCDKEGNNLLALNLAHDIIIGKKTVAEARLAYGTIVKQKMHGGNPEYMKKLTFSPQPNAADPDKNTTGLTKEDVMKGIKKAGVN